MPVGCHCFIRKGLESSMGFFGMAAGHMDDSDNEAGLMCIISNSCILGDYKPGCFHLFGVGMYIIVKLKTASLFSGLGKHGETSPIKPNSVMVV